jgi:uncharacterized membrane protein YcaP (DUF421 family)
MEILRAVIGPDNGDATAVQLCVRAVLLFLFGVACIRITGRRTFSQATPLDIIVALVVGSNISRAMTGKAPFFPSLAATLLLVILHRAVAMAALKWGWLALWVKCSPIVLVKDGAADHRAMFAHGIGDTDLEESLRMEQVEHVSDVRLATLESGGKISVVPRRPSR